ncbi:MAG: glycosyltransferase [Acidobacteriia bacterium]|nr:glycosyltransferase [Terriglobia bacterium]
MAPFIEEAIARVLAQDYPKIDYIVLDGGSTDGTLEILRKYEGRLRYESRPDKGQVDAINRGFLLSHGPIVAFLNADDSYLPQAVGNAVGHLLANPSFAVVYGEAYLVAEDGTCLGLYPTKDFDAQLLQYECFICQPTTFLWSSIFAESGLFRVVSIHAPRGGRDDA